MTDEPIEFFEDDETPEPKPISSGLGCFYGGVAVVASILISGLVSALLVNLFSQTDISAPIGFITSLLPLGLLIFAGIYWRRVPGFLLGIALTIGISIVVVGACTALLISQFG
jgi:MFS superfamily sulfate permease-like transporter